MTDEPGPHRTTCADADRACYLAFAQTWVAVARLSGFTKQQIERRLIRYFQSLCVRVRPTIVLEIGAHEATFSRWAAEELPGARVLAFEANPYVHQTYADELAQTRVDYRNLAVGPVTGAVQLNIPTEVDGRRRSRDSRMASLGVHTRASGHVQVTVPSVRLDDHVTTTGDDRVVAWIDVEGANAPVLQSGPAVLARAAAIHIEVERDITWEGQWLDTDVALCLRDHGLVPLARDVRKAYQYNVVYVRADLALDPEVAHGAAVVMHRRRGRQVPASLQN